MTACLLELVIVVQVIATMVIAYYAYKQHRISKFAQLLAIANWRRVENKDLLDWIDELKQDPARNAKVIEAIEDLMKLTDEFIKEWNKS